MFNSHQLKKRGHEWVAFLAAVRAAGGPAAYELQRDRAASLARADLTVHTVEAIEAEWRDGLAALVAQVPEAAELRAATRTGTPPRQVWGFVGALLRAARERLEATEGERLEARAALLAMTEKWQAAEREIVALRALVGPARDESADAAAKKAARARREHDRVAAATAQACPKCCADPGRPCMDQHLNRPIRAPHRERFEGLSPSRGASAAEQPGADAPTTKEEEA